MKYNLVKKKVIEVIREELQKSKETNEHRNSFYIGKTNDYERRKQEHDSKSPFQQEGMPDVNCYNEMYALVKCESSETIAKLEAELIEYFLAPENGYQNQCENKNGGSAGSEKSNTVYILFCREINDIDSLYNDCLPLRVGMPFEIDV